MRLPLRSVLAPPPALPVCTREDERIEVFERAIAQVLSCQVTTERVHSDVCEQGITLDQLRHLIDTYRNAGRTVLRRELDTLARKDHE
ncbi:MAG: hypothetical protein MJE77_30235 [Proteobacteria bacterium]|nr:hypothetical protein [Pseudomonadota bacterium]